MWGYLVYMERYGGSEVTSSIGTEDCLRAVLADLKIENMTCTPEEIDLLRRYLNGEMTKQEHISAVLALAKKAFR